MSEDNKMQTLRVRSTPFIYVPGMIRNCQHMYKYGWNSNQAIEVLRDIFSGTVKDEALISILVGDREPLYDEEDLRDDAVSYVFKFEELNLEALAEFDSDES